MREAATSEQGVPYTRPRSHLTCGPSPAPMHVREPLKPPGVQRHPLFCDRSWFTGTTESAGMKIRPRKPHNPPALTVKGADSFVAAASPLSATNTSRTTAACQLHFSRQADPPPAGACLTTPMRRASQEERGVPRRDEGACLAVQSTWSPPGHPRSAKPAPCPSCPPGPGTARTGQARALRPCCLSARSGAFPSCTS